MSIIQATFKPVSCSWMPSLLVMVSNACYKQNASFKIKFPEGIGSKTLRSECIVQILVNINDSVEVWTSRVVEARLTSDFGKIVEFANKSPVDTSHWAVWIKQEPPNGWKRTLKMELETLA